MGNNPSAASKAGTPGSSSSGPSHHASGASSAGPESPRHPTRKDAHNILQPHTIQPSVAPPEASLAQAQGSTIVNRPKSIPTTAVSSLSGSPLSSTSAGAKTAPASSEPRTSREEHERTKPVDVPLEASSLRSHQSSHQPPLPETFLVANSSITDMYLRGPPRLPLPIEEEVHTPGSPILEAHEGLSDIDLGESSDGLTRKSSALSATTVDEDDAEELRVDKTRPVVPTRLEWKRGGNKIYVTGTIFQWNRKHRLHPVEGKPRCSAATIYILPGTHHVRFLVDGIMQTSPDLPTTVDFGGNLVNYIEVNPDDVLQQKHKATPPKHDAALGPEPDADGGIARTSSQKKEQPRTPKGKAVLPKETYETQIPQYLRDFDEPEDSSAYQNAVGAIEKLPTPPSLPGFLAKPIMNAATLMKDDNSVLNMPNHTVLNHLATCSIKNNTLAVSATTRYRNKYVTTIMYKPASMNEA